MFGMSKNKIKSSKVQKIFAYIKIIITGLLPFANLIMALSFMYMFLCTDDTYKKYTYDTYKKYYL